VVKSRFSKKSSKYKKPKVRTVLRYKTLDELASDAGLSRIYGGIHTFETNEVSQELADWVYERTVAKLMGEFKFGRK